MKKIIFISLWAIAIIAIIGLLIFANKLFENRKCDNLNITIEYGTGDRLAEEFITYEDIQEFVNQRFNKIKGNKVKEINIEKIEKTIEKMAYIRKVDCTMDINGDVNLNIKQRRPILRIINNRGDNYYIDETGTILPGRVGYSSRVVTANGYVSDSLFDKENTCLMKNDSLLHRTTLGKLFKLAYTIDRDTFLRQEIVQIYVNEKHEFEMIPLVGDHTILFGDAVQIKDKFWRLEQFYKNGIRLGGWDKYKTINLKYQNQIVCTKKNYNYGIQ